MKIVVNISKKFKDISFSEYCNVSAIQRRGEIIIPNGLDYIMPGDHVFIICRDGDVQAVQTLFGHIEIDRNEKKRIMIVGCGDIGLYLATALDNNYTAYSYFAFTALGCDVKKGERENGEEYQYPVGPVLPKRIEEPLLWLFYKFGYIGKNADLPGEICCPNCGAQNSVDIPGGETVYDKQGLFRKSPGRYVNRRCKICGYKWEYIPE